MRKLVFYVNVLNKLLIYFDLKIFIIIYLFDEVSRVQLFANNL